MYSHPAYTRYPHLKTGPSDVKYTKWTKVFAWRPRKTVGGETVWLRHLYKRQKTVGWHPPQFPREAFNRTEYETIENVILRKLSGEN